MMVAVPPATAAYRVPRVTNAAKLGCVDGARPAMAPACRTRDMPIGIVIAIVAASETHVEITPTIAM
jgi:hypothetical protein